MKRRGERKDVSHRFPGGQEGRLQEGGRVLELKGGGEIQGHAGFPEGGEDVSASLGKRAPGRSKRGYSAKKPSFRDRQTRKNLLEKKRKPQGNALY